MNELLLQTGAFGVMAIIAVGLLRLLEKTWDKRNNNGSHLKLSMGDVLGKGGNNSLLVITKIEASLDSMTQFHQELVQDLREIRENQERMKSTLTRLEVDSKYLRSWHEKTEDGRVAAYFPYTRLETQHTESMNMLRDIAVEVKKP